MFESSGRKCSRPIGRRRSSHKASGAFLILILQVMGLALLLCGCASSYIEQDSDWRWKQFNPYYRPPDSPRY